MRLGVFFIGNPQSGGIYQYSLSILDSLKNRSEKVVILNLSGAYLPDKEYRNYFKISNPLKLTSLLKQLGANICLKLRADEATPIARNTDEKTAPSKRSSVGKTTRLLNGLDILLLRLLMKLNGINLLIFTTYSNLSFKLRIPYIMPVHDLQHRLNPQFPEVSANGIWEEREYFFTNSIPNAEAILVDSETGLEDVLKFYPTDKEKIKVLPYPPPNYLRRDYGVEELGKIREKYHLPPRFLFYPANFWPHKNHKLIIQALNNIKINHRLKISVVFVGSNPVRYGEFDNVWELADKYGLKDQVYYHGYVPNKDMGVLYKLADALVMPTFFGPTNIPYLEAFAVGCPVIGSDIRGIREQIGDAGLLVDPTSSEDLAAAILKIWNDAGLRESLIRRGYDKIRSWNFEKFSETLNKFIDETEEQLAGAS